MSDIINVFTQIELDAALAEPTRDILICGAGIFEIADSAQVRASGSAQVTAYDSAQVTAYGSAQVTAYGSAQVTAYDSAQVTAYGSAQVTAYGSAQVTASGSAQVTAYGSAQVTAYGSAQVTAYGSAQVTAYGSAQVTASDSAQVTAYGSARVTAYDSAQVRASGSAQVTAYDSAQVRAYGSAQVTAYGSARVTAGRYCAVTVPSEESHVRVDGGVVIRVPAATTPEAWCDRYNVAVVAGVATVYKAVLATGMSAKGTDYSPGLVPVAADWDGGRAECGYGLHFSPRPWMALRFIREATRFIACAVRLSDMRAPRATDEYPEKIKAVGCCAPTRECDQDGNALGGV